MWYFVLKRLILTLPTIFLVLAVVFVLTRLISGDPVLFAIQSDEFTSSQQVRRFDANLYNQTAQNLGLDKPVFYFSVVPANLPADFYQLPPLQRKFAFELIRQYGQPERILKLNHQYEDFLKRTQVEYRPLQNLISGFPSQPGEVINAIRQHPGGNQDTVLKSLRETLEALINTEQRNLSPIPYFIWHGLNNQFHQWIVNSFSLKFGLSVVDGQPASRKIWLALRWTLIINILSIAIGYFLAILTGVYAGWWGGAFDRMMSLILYFIYSIPVFWLTTILIVFFTTREYGSWTNIFPAAGIIRAEASDPFLKVISRNAGQLIIPVMVLSTSLMAYIARIVRNSIAEEQYKSYVTHARTKGLTEHYILWKHVFRNASFPLITLLASVLPASLAGSLVVEVICNLPGSGRLLYDAVIDHDWPVVNGVIMISALMTILGLLVSDILYRVADPRIKWQ